MVLSEKPQGILTSNFLVKLILLKTTNVCMYNLINVMCM
jgi:hypothetical protein